MLSEQARLPNGNRLVRLATNNQHGPALGSGAPLENYCTIDYTVTPDGSVIASTVLRYSYKSFADLPVLSGYTFTQDQHANPLRDLYMEVSYYQFEWERSSPHNLVLELERGKPFKSTAWRYNAAGHPVYGVVSNGQQQPYRDYTFTYANVVVPAPTRAPQVAADSVGRVSLYPNPATATTVVKAPGIGPGEATLRLFNASGQLQRQTSFAVTQSFAETISVVGLAKGVYVVQISNGTGVATGRLEVD